ncbi:MAG: hypothetical protein ABIG61_02460 [Planctomycetota bacterium]
MGKDEEKVEYVTIEDEFGRCPQCGYDRGFHSFFRKTMDNGHLKWLLVCPKCGGRFDVGLQYKIE